jgi:hypothetical protein
MNRISRLFSCGLAVLLLCVFAFPAFARASQDTGGAGGSAGLKDLDTSKPVEVIMYYTGDLNRGHRKFTTILTMC